MDERTRPKKFSRRETPSAAERAGEAVRLAARGSAEEIEKLLHHTNEDVIFALVTNPNMKELQRLHFLRRRDLPITVFPRIAGSKEWMKDQAVRLALARNPKTPQYVFQPLLGRFLVMDLLKVANDPYVTADRKVYINRMVAERIPGLPLGTRMNLAVRAGPDVAQALLMGDPPRKLVEALLPGNCVTERMIVRAIGASIRNEEALSAIAVHERWGKPHAIRLALAKNPKTAEGHRRRILTELTMHDLREIMEDCSGYPHVVVLAKEELDRRPGDGRARKARPLTSDEVRDALSEMKKRRGKPAKKSASEIRGAALDISNTAEEEPPSPPEPETDA